MRALEPARTGYVARHGVRIYWEEFGAGEPTIALLPTWSIVHSRHWKFQVPYLSRHHRVVTFDGRGCGLSDRPAGAAHYAPAEFAADTLAVLDATRTESAVLVALACGALWGVQLAADHPERVLGLVAIGPAVPLAPAHPERAIYPFDEPIEPTGGWAKYNAAYWRRDYADFLAFFAGRIFTEPHSTKQCEDFVEWASEIDPDTLIDAEVALVACGLESFRGVCERVRCPLLVIHGDEDAVRPHAQGAALADVARGELVAIGAGGHAPPLRDPVVVNQLIKRFVERVGP